MFRLQCQNRNLPTAPGLLSREAQLRAVATLFLLLTALPLPAKDSTPPGCRAKANSLANFPSSDEWPQEALPSEKAQFLICLFGEFPFGTSLAEITRGTTIHHRRCGEILVIRNGCLRIRADVERFAS